MKKVFCLSDRILFSVVIKKHLYWLSLKLTPRTLCQLFKARVYTKFGILFLFRTVRIFPQYSHPTNSTLQWLSTGPVRSVTLPVQRVQDWVHVDSELRRQLQPKPARCPGTPCWRPATCLRGQRNCELTKKMLSNPHHRSLFSYSDLISVTNSLNQLFTFYMKCIFTFTFLIIINLL